MNEMKISNAMQEQLDQAAQRGYQGEMVFANRRTEDALRRRGLITNDYDDTTFATKKWGYRNPVLTVAGWAAANGERQADPGRYTVEQALEEAYEINATPRALVAPEACSCPDFPALFEQYGHAEACPDFRPTVIDNLEENLMTESTPPLKDTKWKGQLSPLQHRILTSLTEGLQHAEIADKYGFTRSYVSENVSAATGKMGMRTTAAAVARYSSYLTYQKAAVILLERGIVRSPIDSAEEHCNHVIEGLAQTLRERSERLLQP